MENRVPKARWAQPHPQLQQQQHQQEAYQMSRGRGRFNPRNVNQSSQGNVNNSTGNWTRGRGFPRGRHNPRQRGSFRGGRGGGRPNDQQLPSIQVDNNDAQFPPRRRKSKRGNNPECDDLDVCCECQKDSPVYKCPNCFQKYCSASCCKSHKEGSNCENSNKKSKINDDDKVFKVAATADINIIPQRKEYMFPTEDTIRPEGLQKLANDPLKIQLLKMLKSESLKMKIKKLDSSLNPRSLFDKFIEDNEFSEFRTFVVENLTGELFN